MSEKKLKLQNSLETRLMYGMEALNPQKCQNYV